ncbi:hypothetical protein BLS_008306 [Venturia inaequalis]|uniref:2EXR domain-containing protein n=1 Tax=Venturia inaequalis TaxID=5025 RepID=A0A8H3V8T7_VENIN|nr:hypothetical protein BLS_008306 [Venturia inaequalis]
MATRHSAGALKRPERGAPFPFLKLPAEVRNKIYVYAVKDSGPRAYISIWRHNPSRKAGSGPARLGEAQPAITKVCRQMRNEALPDYYAENVFEVSLNRVWGSYYAEKSEGYLVELLDGEMVVPRQMFWRAFVAGDTWELKYIRTIRIGCPFNLNVRIRKDNSGLEICGMVRRLKTIKNSAECTKAARQILEGLGGNVSGRALNGLHLLKIAAKVNTRRPQVLSAVKSSPAWVCCNCNLCQHWEDGDWELIPSHAHRGGSNGEGGFGLGVRRQAAGEPSQADLVARLMASNMEF